MERADVAFGVHYSVVTFRKRAIWAATRPEYCCFQLFAGPAHACFCEVMEEWQ
jgi:hypothetical protein